MACLDLTPLTDSSYESLTRVLTSIDILVVEAGISHELAQEAGICCHSRDYNSHMLIDFKELLLVDCQIVRTLL